MRMGFVTALVASVLTLGGCSSSIWDTPGDGQARPKEAGGYLPVYDLPPARTEATMKPEDQARAQADLAAARDRQAVLPNATTK
jgi:hypothetical protein